MNIKREFEEIQTLLRAALEVGKPVKKAANDGA